LSDATPQFFDIIVVGADVEAFAPVVAALAGT
jgi:hypothetical protein